MRKLRNMCVCVFLEFVKLAIATMVSPVKTFSSLNLLNASN